MVHAAYVFDAHWRSRCISSPDPAGKPALEGPMSDFYQNGVVTVLHRLGQSNLAQLARALVRYGRDNPTASDSRTSTSSSENWSVMDVPTPSRWSFPHSMQNWDARH